jgi:hypothetical protein
MFDTVALERPVLREISAWVDGPPDTRLVRMRCWFDWRSAVCDPGFRDLCLVVI